jgi:serine/threonine protein kinase
MDGSAEQFQRADAIFDAALDLHTGERARFVEQACGSNTELLAAVRRLLNAYAASAHFLDRPAPEQSAALLHSVMREDADRMPRPLRFGPFRIHHEIGRGGMGTVYLAERDDGQFKQRVAIKVASAGLSAEHTVQRFLRERRILAALEHPHIARLIDGGVTPEGIPWFAMEFIEGQSITRYCAEWRLTLHARLRLFRDACAAVEYVHSAGVVHRDVKPGNVLVTNNGTLKLVDFGIARLLEPEDPGPDSAVTRTAHALLTPEYAAPEQLRGEPVTAVSDIYALGVVLYELLTGDRPHRLQGHSPAAMERIVCEVEPTQPSVAVRRRNGEWRPLRGDLDTIVMKALQKQPERRYASVAALVEDLDRFSQFRPVLARPDTLAYRASRYVRRHRGALAVAAFVPAMTLASVAYVQRSTDASLLSRGVLQEHEELVLADFDVAGSDSSLGPLLTDALRLHIDQSPVISIIPRDRLLGVLRLLGDRPIGTQLDVVLARDVAQREGIRAILAGSLTPQGRHHVLALRLVAASSGDELASFEERVANPERDLLPAIGRLAVALRQNIGESLRDVRAPPVLDPVTTGSLGALRQYTQARRLLEGDASTAVALLREAIAIDSNFAMAYLVLATHLHNAGVSRAPRDSAIARAYTLRERVTPRERAAIEALYSEHVLQDRRQAAVAYETQLARDSGDLRSIFNYGALLLQSRQLTRAESHHRAFEAVIGERSVRNFAAVLLAQGKVAAADSIAAAALAARGDNPNAVLVRAAVELARFRFDSAAVRIAHARALLWSPLSQLSPTRDLARIARVRGRFAEASRLATEVRDLTAAVGVVPPLLRDSLTAAREDLWIRNQPGRAAARLDAALTAHPVASLRAGDDYENAVEIAALYAAAGRSARARETLREVLQMADARTLRAIVPQREAAVAEIALAAGRPVEAMAAFRRSDVAADGLPATTCDVCILPALARAAERAGWSDSARTFWETYVNKVSVGRLESDAWFLATAYRRLAEMHARGGDYRKAADYQRRFIALWQDADEELRPQVEAARQWLARRRP